MKKHEVYTSQFKREAVRLLESSEKPASYVARQLGVRRWIIAAPSIMNVRQVSTN